LRVPVLHHLNRRPRSRLAVLVEDMPADHAAAWQAQIDSLQLLSDGELKRGPGLEWTALAV
jgi:hypothetical protein